MRLLRLAEVPVTPRDRLFKNSPARALFVALPIVAAGFGLIWFAWRERFWVPGIGGAGALLGVLLFRATITARFRPSNWLIRASADQLYVKFRSYLNHHFPDSDTSVVAVPYREIRSARVVRQRRDVPDSDSVRGVTEHRRTVVELELDADTTELARVLKEELARKGPTVYHWWGSGSTRYGHYPVRLSSQVLEVEWRVVPGFRTLFEVLAPFVTILPPAKVKVDFTRLDEAGKKAQETKLLELVEAGDAIAAIKIARQIYGYDLAQARDFVDGLRGEKRV